MPVSFLGGKYRVNLQTRGGIRYTVSIRNGCIVGGTISYPNGTTQKVMARAMISILRKVILGDSIVGKLGQGYRLNTSISGLNEEEYRHARTHGVSEIESDKVDAVSVEEVMDDFYGGTRPNVFSQPPINDVLQSLQNALDRNCKSYIDPYGNFQTIPQS